MNSMFQLNGFDSEANEENFLLIFHKNGSVSEKRLNNFERIDLPPPQITISENLDLSQMDGIVQADE